MSPTTNLSAPDGAVSESDLSSSTRADRATPAAEEAPLEMIGLPAAPSPASTTTRRTLLGAGLGALAATVATSMGRPQPASAADGDPVQVGQSRLARTPTVFQNQENNNDILVAKSVSTGTGGNGGGAAIHGDSDAGRGVWGTSQGGNGVEGRSDTRLGVYGYCNSGDGVHGYSGAGDGVSGYTDTAGTAKAGLRGLSNTEQSYGAFAENLVVGTKGSLGGPKAGVVGQAPNALGFIGVAATAPEAATALSVNGKAQFSRSGKASVGAGRSFVDVAVPGGLSSGSLVVATPMLNRPGVYVQSAVPNATTGNVRIYLNRVASSSFSTPVAWFVIN